MYFFECISNCLRNYSLVWTYKYCLLLLHWKLQYPKIFRESATARWSNWLDTCNSTAIFTTHVNFNGSNRSHSQNVNSLNGAAIGRSRLTIAVRGSLFITIQICCLLLLSAYFKIKNSLSFAATFPFIYFFKVSQSWRINKKCLTIVCELYSW